MIGKKKNPLLQSIFWIILIIISIYGYEYIHLITQRKAVQTDAQFMKEKHPINFYEYVINVAESNNDHKYERLRFLGGHDNGMIRLTIAGALYKYSIIDHDDKLAMIANYIVSQEDDERFVLKMLHEKEKYESNKN